MKSVAGRSSLVVGELADDPPDNILGQRLNDQRLTAPFDRSGISGDFSRFERLQGAVKHLKDLGGLPNVTIPVQNRLK